MEERVKALQAFMKSAYTVKQLQEMVSSARTNLSEVGIDIDPSLSLAERLDKAYTKLGMGPKKRKFYVDLICGLEPEIGDEEDLREERDFYSSFRVFESAQRLRIAFGLEPLY